MPIQFRCPACDRRLSIATRKAGTHIACPACGATATVPDPDPAEQPEPLPAEAPSRRFPLAILAGVGLIALVALVGVAVGIALHKPAAPKAEQAKLGQPVAPPVVPPVPVQQQQPSPAVQPGTAQSPRPQEQPQQTTPTPAEQGVTQPAPQPTNPPQPPVPAVAPPPRPVVVRPPPPELDRFGNPVGNYGLGQDGEFKGKKILFWCAFENAGRVFFAADNPLWKALEAKGFAVARAFGRFDPRWLKEVDQLWILSCGRLEIPGGVSPELLVEAVSLLPAEAIPSGFTAAEYQFIVRATLDVALSPAHPLDEKAFRAIEDFVKAGKGLCLLADDEPFTLEANELARRLFGARVGGNYLADKTAFVKGRGLTPEQVRKFGGQFEVDDHALLTGVNFLFEGITVSNIGASPKLDAALKASDGKTLIAVSNVPGQRVVIDCGFTRYCHGPTPRTSYIQKTAGTVRLGQNIAAFLAGKEAPK